MKQVFIGLIILMTGCATAPTSDPFTLTKQHFIDTMHTEGDELDAGYYYSTKNGYTQKHGLWGLEWSDASFRAVKDKKTGTQEYSIYFAMKYNSSSWHFYNGATCLLPAGVKFFKLNSISKDVKACNRHDCLYAEHFYIDINQDEMKSIYDQYSNGKMKKLQCRLMTKQGGKQDFYFNAAEPAAIYEMTNN